MPQGRQLGMWSADADAASGGSASTWGLVVEHRRLLESLQDEWLQPAEGEAGHLLLAGGTPAEDFVPPKATRTIHVALGFSPADLPTHDVLVHRRGLWEKANSQELPMEACAVWWPGPLPLTSVATVAVATEEQRVRLQSIVRQVSNVELSKVHVERERSAAVRPPPDSERQALSAIGFPPNYDSVRGAAAMAWWALPRTDPWFDLLVASLGGSDEELEHAATRVEAPWLTSLPWRTGGTTHSPTSPYEALWRSSFGVLTSWEGRSSIGLVEALVRAAEASCSDRRRLQAWAEETKRILRAETPIEHTDVDDPVGAALQRFLTRSPAERYKTWRTVDPTLPPAVWWSGALLAGAFSGYRRLPSGLRGEASLRAFLALHLTARGTDAPRVSWSHGRKAVQFVHGSTLLAERAETPRGAWYRANLGEDTTRVAAIREATRLGWPCVMRVMHLTSGSHHWSGPGELRHTDATLEVEGTIRVALNSQDRVEDELDPDGFRRCLVTLGGQVETPPPLTAEAASTRSHAGARLPSPKSGVAETVYVWRSAVEPNVPEVPGLVYVPDFLSSEEQDEVLRAVDGSEWSEELKRRVQHYGWRYDYRARRVRGDMRIGELPPWAARLADRLQEDGLLPWIADQVIVNEYVGKQGISPHIDLPGAFEGAVAMVSLVEAWHMRFKHPPTKKRVEHLLACGSAAVMTGPARYEWTHEIPSRKTENRRKRHRRVSLTFRKVRTDARDRKL